MRSALQEGTRFFFTIRSLARSPRVVTFYYSTLSHYDSTKMNAQINGHFLILPIIIHRNQQKNKSFVLICLPKIAKKLFQSTLMKFQILCRDLKVPFWQPFKSAQTDLTMIFEAPVFIELLQKDQKEKIGAVLYSFQ